MVTSYYEFCLAYVYLYTIASYHKTTIRKAEGDSDRHSL